MFEPHRVKRAAKAAGQAAVEGGLFYFAHPYIDKALEPWTPDAVRQAIEGSLDLFGDVNLSEYKEQVQPYLALVRHLSVETMVQWLEVIRPDLAGAVNATPGGDRWLTQQLETLMRKVFDL